MFLVRVQCPNGHQWDADGDAGHDTLSREQYRPNCPQCGEPTTGPVDPPTLTFKMQLKRTGADVDKAPVIRIG